MKRGLTVWLTGLSGAGKTTIAYRLGQILADRGHRVELLDGDVFRQHLSKGLGYSKEDRDENIRRVGWVAERLTAHGVTAIVAVISPYREIREEVKERIGDFVEIFVKCPVEVLIRRDTKGLYRKALAGEILKFTGISDPYEEPVSPNLTLDTAGETIEESVARVLASLEENGYVLPAAKRG